MAMGLKTESWYSGIMYLESELSARDAKYRRNFRMYTNSYRGEDIRNPFMQPLGFAFSVDDDVNNPPPVINATQSVVDTVCSTMSQLKTRPFFNPVNGKFDTRKAARDVQRYMDDLFDNQKVYTESPEALRLAAVCEVGYFWIDDINNMIRKIRPWEFYYSQGEYQFGEISRYHLRFDKYPVAALRKYYQDQNGKDPTGFKGQFRSLYGRDMFATCTYRIAYDLIEKVRIEFMDRYEISRTKLSDGFDEPNIAEMYFKKPMKGSYSTSLVDDVYTLQLQINDICRKISAAINLTPANFVLVPKGQNQIKPAMIKSDIGYVYEFTPIPGAPPIQIVAPAAVDQSYVAMLQFFLQQVFKQPGISDMQALGERPASVQSGYAIDTLNNIFSNRQNTILINYLQMQVDIARKSIKCFDPSFVLPSKAKNKVTMGDVKKQLDLLTIDISATSSLSRDPKTKQDQIQQMVQGGLMTTQMAAQYLEMPDLEDAYSVVTASQDYNRWIVERVVKEGKFDFYQVTDMAELFQLVVSELLQCAASGEDQSVLENLTDFLNILQANNLVMNPPPPVPIQPGMGVPGPQSPNPGVAGGPQPQGAPAPQGV